MKSHLSSMDLCLSFSGIFPSCYEVGEDYQDTIAILSFPSHITGSAVVSKSFSVDILSDLLLEGDEQFVCEIVMVSHERVHIGPNSRVLVTIVDDDCKYTYKMVSCIYM